MAKSIPSKSKEKHSTATEQHLLTPDEAAQLKGVSRTTIYSAIAQKRLTAVRVLGRLALEKKDVETWVPAKYKERPGTGGGRPTGIPISEATKAKMSEARKVWWSEKKKRAD